MNDVIIVGAGVSGLTAARKLHEQNLNVLILEKSRGLGGRLSTKRGPGWQANTGIQTFDTQETELIEWTRDALKEEPLSLSKVARSIIQDLSISILTQKKVMRVRRETQAERLWALECEDGSIYSAKMILLTAPLLQAMELLKDSALLTPEISKEASMVQYEACLTGVFTTNPIEVIQEHGEAAKENWDLGSDQNLARLWKQAGHLESVPEGSVFHRWKYSQATQTLPELFFRAHDGLYLCGDAFGRGGLTGAFLSGMAVSDAILSLN